MVMEKVTFLKGRQGWFLTRGTILAWSCLETKTQKRKNLSKFTGGFLQRPKAFRKSPRETKAKKEKKGVQANPGSLVTA